MLSPQLSLSGVTLTEIMAALANFGKNLVKVAGDLSKTNRVKPKTKKWLIPLLLISGVICAYVGTCLMFLQGSASLIGHAPSGEDLFSPHTSMVFPISGLYIDKFNISRYTASSTASWNTSLYLLHEVPSQTDEYEFHIESDFLQLKSGEYYQWSFYLRNGSRYSVAACAWVGSTVKLHVIKGTAEFNRWTNSRASSGEHVLPYCNTSRLSKQLFIAANVSNDNKYYFVYDNKSTVVSVNVSLQMNFTALDYVVKNASRNCSCVNSSCAIRLPFSFRGVAVVQTSAPNGTNWEEKRHVSWDCESSYNGYLLLCFFPLSFFFLCFYLCCTVLCITGLFCAKNRNGYQPQPATNASNTRVFASKHNKCCVFFYVMLIVLVFQFTFFEGVIPILAYSGKRSLNTTLYPGDTKIISFDSFFCKSYTIEGHGSSYLSAELFISAEEPPRTTHSLFVNKTANLSTQYSCNLFLREQSAYFASLCLEEGGNANFVVIKGTKNYHNWLLTAYLEPDWPRASVNNSCEMKLNHHLQITIENADRYYFVLYRNSSLLSIVHLVLNLNRSEYAPNYKNTTVSSCSIGPHKNNECTAIAPGIGGRKALVVVSEYLWTESLSVLGTCNLRGDTWTAIWLPVLVLNIIFFSLLFTLIKIAIVRWIKWKKPPPAVAERLIPSETTPLNYGSINTGDEPAVVEIVFHDETVETSDHEIVLETSDHEPVLETSDHEPVLDDHAPIVKIASDHKTADNKPVLDTSPTVETSDHAPSVEIASDHKTVFDKPFLESASNNEPAADLEIEESVLKTASNRKPSL